MTGDQAQRLRELARLTNEAEVADALSVEAVPVDSVPDDALPAEIVALPSVGAPVRRVRTIVVTSGKGGVGKTNVTVNLALAFARRHKKTILYDADLGMANVDVLMGISPRYSVADVIRGHKTLSEVLLWVNDYLGIVPGGSGIADLANLDPERLEGLVAQLGELEAQAELILVDTGAGISRNVVNFVLAADEILVVTTPEPTAITDAYGMIKEIDSHNPHANIQLLVNMTDSEAEARSVAAKLAMIVERFLTVRIQYLGCIERDPMVPRSVLQQKPFSTLYPQTTAARRLAMLAGSLLAQGEDPPEVSEGFFSRLIKQVFRQDDRSLRFRP